MIIRGLFASLSLFDLLVWFILYCYRHFLVCYYTNYKDESGTNRLVSNTIDPHLCTHIIIGFATVANCTINLGDETIYKQVTELKEKQPKLKVMVSVGGADNDSGFAEMVLNYTNRKT